MPGGLREMGNRQRPGTAGSAGFSTGAAMLLHVKVTVYPLAISAGRVG